MAKREYTKPEISREQLEVALYEANLSLQKTNETLREEEEARNTLLSNLSHDLRSPVMALLSAVGYLRSGAFADAPEYTQTIDLMERRLKTIQTMIDDLFLLTKIECPTIPLVTEEIDMGFFLEEFFYSCQADQKYAGRHLLLELPKPFPYLARIDAEKFLRVLDNLFTNALQYSSEGATITLGAAYRPVSPEQGALEITVRDTGIGIAPEHIPLIFNRSFRVSTSRTPGQGGSGLGLAIVKGIVERHGGAIRCESEPGKGSCFSITLPARPLQA